MTPEAGMALATKVRDALAAAGVPRTSRHAGGEVRGLIDPNHHGSVGFAVREYPDRLEFHVVVSGKPAGMRYRRWSESQDNGDSIDLHEPTNPMTAEPKIRAAFAAAGLNVREVRHTGHQMHWDDDVDFEVVTAKPGRGKADPGSGRPGPGWLPAAGRREEIKGPSGETIGWVVKTREGYTAFGTESRKGLGGAELPLGGVPQKSREKALRLVRDSARKVGRSRAPSRTGPYADQFYGKSENDFGL
jgi:hypothetical protein